MRDRTPYYDSDNPSTVVRGGTWRSMVWIACVVVFFMLLGALVFGIKTLTAEPAGRAGAYRQKESANNRIFAQQHFEELAAEIEATQAKIARAAAVEKPTDQQVINLDGLQNYCASVVADYNKSSRSYTTQQFKAADLPASYNPATDCEATR